MVRFSIRRAASTLVFLAAACGANTEERDTAREEPRNQFHAAGTALEDDCRYSGPNPDGSVQFVLTCPQAVRSPDGKWTLVQSKAAGENETYRVYVARPDGTIVDDVTGLDDAMPFVLYWSPRSDWFAVNHHIGSFMDAPEVYEIGRDRVIRHDQFRHVAQAEAHRMFPCLPPDGGEVWLAGSIFRWSRDGRKLAWAFTTRPNMCHLLDENPPSEPDWESFLMVSDVETGEIEPGSIRILNEERFADVELPSDGPYAAF